MSNVTINQLPAANTIDPVSDLLAIYQNSSTSTLSINRNTFLGLASAPVGLTDTQTLTNKTITSPTISGPTLSGTITGTYTIGGTPTFPSSVVQLTSTQTLTNKTLTSPTINSPTITNATISTDAITGFTTSTSGTLYGISIANSQITSALTLTNSLTVGGLLTASNGLTVSAGSISVPNTTAFIVPANLFASTGTSWVWQSWTPSWTGSTIGNSTVAAKYVQIGKTVLFNIAVTVGSTFALAVGADTTFTLPVTTISDYKQFMILGNGSTLHTSTINPLAIAWNTSTTGLIQASLVTGNSVVGGGFDTAHLTLATNDTFNLTGFYQAA